MLRWQRNTEVIPGKTMSAVKESLISVAGLIGRPVIHLDGQEVGRLVDLVFRWDTKQSYPPLSGILVKVGRRISWIAAPQVEAITRSGVKLRTTTLDLRDFQASPEEVRLAQDVLDHQLVDVNDIRVVRASDLYIATIANTVRLFGVDVGYGSLIRRLGPASLRSRPTPGAVIDWATIRSFGGETGDGQKLKLTATRNELHKLRPAELADLLEDLGRSERQELLTTLSAEQAADALEEMEPDERESLLRESRPEEAAELLAKMEPDEAADTLRDMDEELRDELLAHMDDESVEQVGTVLAHREDSAGGSMNSDVVTALPSETIGDLQKRLKASDQDLTELDAIAIVDANGKLLHDVPLAVLFLASSRQHLQEFIQGPEPVAVPPELDIEEVAELLIANRSSSLLVVNEKNEPIGRILADDVVDALLPEERERFRFPRLLS